MYIYIYHLWRPLPSIGTTAPSAFTKCHRRKADVLLHRSEEGLQCVCGLNHEQGNQQE